MFDYEVLSLCTKLAAEFSTLYCSSKNCALVSSVFHGSHVSRSVGRSFIAKRYQIIWVKHSQACSRVVKKKKKLNGIKISVTNHSSLYKENCIPGVKRARIQVPLLSILAGNHSPFYGKQWPFLIQWWPSLEEQMEKSMKKKTFYYSLQSKCKNSNDLKKHLFIKELMKVWVSTTILLN